MEIDGLILHFTVHVEWDGTLSGSAERLDCRETGKGRFSDVATHPSSSDKSVSAVRPFLVAACLEVQDDSG